MRAFLDAAQCTAPVAEPLPALAPVRRRRSRVDSAFARLVRALPIGVMLVDRACHVEFANAAAGTIFGFDPDRALERSTSSRRFPTSSWSGESPMRCAAKRRSRR